MEHPSSKYSPESMYLLHKIYLNEFEEYDLSIIFLKQSFDNFSKVFFSFAIIKKIFI